MVSHGFAVLHAIRFLVLYDVVNFRFIFRRPYKSAGHGAGLRQCPPSQFFVSEVVLVANDGVEVGAHRAILCARSEYFRTMFPASSRAARGLACRRPDVPPTPHGLRSTPSRGGATASSSIRASFRSHKLKCEARSPPAECFHWGDCPCTKIAALREPLVQVHTKGPRNA